jgi:hypothetical protein
VMIVKLTEGAWHSEAGIIMFDANKQQQLEKEL